MFGDHRNQAFWLHTPFAFLDDLDIPMLEQAIPVGSVGYIHPMTRKFIMLFNAIDPGSSPDARLESIPSLLDGGVTTMVTDPNRSQGVAWEHDYDAKSLLADWIQGGSLYTVGYDHPELLFLTLGRACSKELVGTHFEAWLLDHKQKILDIFGDEHPYIRNRLELVTTAVDSSQYGRFAHLGSRSLRLSWRWTQKFYFQVASPHVPGNPWGEFELPKYHDPHDLISWSHVSTVGQPPMTVHIRCQSLT
ncbi:hypothetical protein EDD85DRAFT_427312 [Armillaria nabsnona]|nr:hypothetical protein EDD85DRAFT_427312 [Armillaria nabsnona]